MWTSLLKRVGSSSSCLCRFHFDGATFGPQEFIRNLKHLSYSTFVILIFRKIFACPSGKLSTEFTSPIAKSTWLELSDTTFLHWMPEVFSLSERLNSESLNGREKPLVAAVEFLTSMLSLIDIEKTSKLIRDITYQSASLVPTVHSSYLLQ